MVTRTEFLICEGNYNQVLIQI